ncbi:MAG: putative membrane protein YfcA [Planctomycetota bacterium]|jgi:uncharacterized membrane protein YfcA
MPPMKFALLIALIVLAAYYLIVFVRAIGKSRSRKGDWIPSPHQALIGFVTNFFDSLGIGNFAPTTVWFRTSKMVPDELIPGTMNVGHSLPVMLMGLLFIQSVEVEPLTLISMIVASIVGAWFGAGRVAKLPRAQVQLGMGIALLLAALFMGGFQVLGKPSGAEALALEGMTLIAGCVGIAILGALMTIGVGLYAPCMVLVSLLGMNPIAAFPIMMGACAFLMPVASTRFLRDEACALRPSLGLTIGGLPGVLIAVLIVKSLPLDTLRWLVVVVVFITGLAMLRAAMRSRTAN